MTRTILAGAVLAALAAGAYAADKDRQAQRGAQTPPGAPAIVLVPLVVAQTPNFGDGCWVRLYDGQNYEGSQLTLVGPQDMPNMRTAFGTDWSGSFDSAQTGPKATVTVYDNENYGQKVATFKPGQRIADLDERRGFFEDIRSLKIACAGTAATGGTQQPQQQSQQKQSEK
jgi:hypothetical protein